MPQCIVRGCASRSVKCKSLGEKLHFFNVPQNDDTRKKWQAVIRSDIVLNSNHYVCGKHFKPEDLVWQKKLIDSQGNVVGIGAPYKVPRLKPGTVPSAEESDCNKSKAMDAIFVAPIVPHVPVASVPPVETTEKTVIAADLTDKCQQSTEPSLCPSEAVDCQNQSVDVQSLGSEMCVMMESEKHAGGHLSLAAFTEHPIKLPNLWVMHNMEINNVPMLRFAQIIPTQLSSSKVVVHAARELILRETENGELRTQLNIMGSVVADSIVEENITNVENIESVDQFIQIINDVSNARICVGYSPSSSNSLDTRMAYKDASGTWRHNNCPLISQKKACSFCLRMKKTTAQREYRLKKREKALRVRLHVNPKEMEALETLRKKKRAAVKGYKRMQTCIQNWRHKLKQNQETIASISAKKLQDLFDEETLSANECTVVREICNAAKCKSKNGRRYSEDWQLLCMLLHMQSPRSYRFLRNHNILPLPDVRTIRKYVYL